MLSTYEPAVWGTQCMEIMKFLLDSEHATKSLATQSFFRDIMHCWGNEAIGQLTFSISQQDASEYVHVWLGLLRTPVFSMAWEKRMSAAAETHVMDCNREDTVPPCLKFDDTTVHLPSCSLTTLVNTWHQVDGMRSALLAASPCICLHIDRCVMGPDLSVHRCNCKLLIDEECFFPIFQNDTIQCEFHGYTTVAVMAHIGSDGAGHYRAALKIRSMVLGSTHPIQWLVTDDWRKPCAVWCPETWLLENVTMAWLVRTDLLKLPFYNASNEADHSSMTELLRLLTEPKT